MLFFFDILNYGSDNMNEKISLIERYAENLTKKVYYADPAIARENEIKTVRIILTCKQNGLSEDSIRGKVREMYV